MKNSPSLEATANKKAHLRSFIKELRRSEKLAFALLSRSFGEVKDSPSLEASAE